MKSFYFLTCCLIVSSLFGQNTFYERHEKIVENHLTLPVEEFKELHFLQVNEENGKSESDDLLFLATQQIDAGIYYYVLKEFKKGRIHFQKAVDLNTFHSIREKAIVYNYLGKCYLESTSNTDTIHICFDRSIELSFAIGDMDLVAKAAINKVDAYNYLDSLKSCLPILNSLTTSRFSNISIPTKMDVYNRLFFVHEHMGNYAQAYRYQLNAIELAKKRGIKREISGELYNMAVFYYNQGEYEKALEYSRESLNLIENKAKFEEDICDSYSLIGAIYREYGQLDSANYFFKRVLKVYEKIDDREGQYAAYCNLGVVLHDMERYQEALIYLQKGMELAEEGRWGKTIGEDYRNMAIPLFELKRYDEAEAYYQKSNVFSKKSGDIETVFMNYYDLALLYGEQKLWEQALVAKDSSFDYFDSLNQMANYNELLALETAYETELKEKENTLLKLDLKQREFELESEQEKKRNWIIAGLILIIILAGISYNLFIRGKLKKSKIAEVQMKVRYQELEEKLLLGKLEKLSLQVSTKNQKIETLEKEVKEVQTANKKSLLDIAAIEKDWLAFTTSFDEVHNNYLKGLKAKYVNLTAYNLRLAALVKLGLSNKEIAQILNISPEGVKKAKQRLKEKLGADYGG